MGIFGGTEEKVLYRSGGVVLKHSLSINNQIGIIQ